MANSGANSNTSQFFITFKDCKHLDLKHTVFGKVVGGIANVDKLEAVSLIVVVIVAAKIEVVVVIVVVVVVVIVVVVVVVVVVVLVLVVV